MSNKLIKIGNVMDRYDNPIAELIYAACKFDSTIIFESEAKKINAKSIMGMMTLSIQSGMLIQVVTDGSDEEKAMSAMEEFLTC